MEVQGSMALSFVDLEKAFGTVPREMVMATLRWMGVPEAGVRMVEGIYEKTTARVVVGEGASEEFAVKMGLRYGSVLSPLLFIAVLYLISRNRVMKVAKRKLLYADQTTWPWWRVANRSQGDSFVYLGGAVCGGGKTERERERCVEEHMPERTRGEPLRG